MNEELKNGIKEQAQAVALPAVISAILAVAGLLFAMTRIQDMLDESFQKEITPIQKEIAPIRQELSEIKDSLNQYARWQSDVDQALLLGRIRSQDRWSATMMIELLDMFVQLNQGLQRPSTEEIRRMQERQMKVLGP